MRTSALLVFTLTLVALAGGVAPVVAAESAKTPVEAPAAVAAAVPTFSFKSNEVDIRDVLQAIARAGGFNLVLSPDVRGKIAIEVKDLPFELALEAVCLTHSLAPYLFDRATRTYLIVRPDKVEEIKLLRARARATLAPATPERRPARWGQNRWRQPRREWRRPQRPTPTEKPAVGADDRDDQDEGEGEEQGDNQAGPADNDDDDEGDEDASDGAAGQDREESNDQ